MNDRQKRKVEDRTHHFFVFLSSRQQEKGNDSTKDLAVGGGVDFSGRRERFHLPDCSKARRLFRHSPRHNYPRTHKHTLISCFKINPRLPIHII